MKKKVKKNKWNKVCYVEYYDLTGGEPNWTAISALKRRKLGVCKSVGFKVVDDEQKITVVSHIEVEGNMGFGEMVIPKSLIINIKEIVV